MIFTDARLLVCDMKKCDYAFAYTLPPTRDDVEELVQWGFFVEQLGARKWRRAMLCPACRKKHAKEIQQYYSGEEEK